VHVRQRGYLALNIRDNFAGSHRDAKQLQWRWSGTGGPTHEELRNVERLGKLPQILLLPGAEFGDGLHVQSMLSIDAVEAKTCEILVRGHSLLLLRFSQDQLMKVHGTPPGYLLHRVEDAQRGERGPRKVLRSHFAMSE